MIKGGESPGDDRGSPSIIRSCQENNINIEDEALSQGKQIYPKFGENTII